MVIALMFRELFEHVCFVGAGLSMFGIFDVLSDRNGIYKVETVKDSFVGVSGAPERVRPQKRCLKPMNNNVIL